MSYLAAAAAITENSIIACFRGIWHGITGNIAARYVGPMRVLAHIHTFNDADIIDRTIEAVLRQTRPVDGILVDRQRLYRRHPGATIAETCHRPAAPGESGSNT